jgi:Lon protease-like protein
VTERIPIFELPLVCLPGEQVPLHIFEPRYQAMTAFCLSEDSPFGIVLRDSDGARSVGCLVRIEEILERFEDGRSNIMGRGTEPFTVLDRIETGEWPEAEIETIGTDDPTDEGPDAEAARETFASIAERATGERPEPAEMDGVTAYEIASRIELPVETKQALLERRDEAERMTLLANALKALERAIDQAEQASERAKSNGSASTNGNSPHP